MGFKSARPVFGAVLISLFYTENSNNDVVRKKRRGGLRTFENLNHQLRVDRAKPESRKDQADRFSTGYQRERWENDNRGAGGGARAKIMVGPTENFSQLPSVRKSTLL